MTNSNAPGADFLESGSELPEDCDAPVLAVSSRKSVVAARSAGIYAVCPEPNGSTEWARGRTVYIVSDRNEASRAQAEKLRRRLEGIAVDVDVAEPAKGCADFIAHLDAKYGIDDLTQPEAPQLQAALKEVSAKQRSVRLVSFADEYDDVPVWAWEYGGKGRIAVGALALFAGRPGAGKSTAGRWAAAQASNGTLEGHWYGHPVSVAYIAAEESAKYIVKPGLRAAGASMGRVFMPKVNLDGEEVRFLSAHDMDNLTRELIAHDVKLVIVDPLMSTIGSKTDINRNNEVRSLIEPWAKLAEKIDGVVLGIAHLNKSGNGDIVAGINGSSAFGEVARAIFGFTKDPESEDGDRIMSQEKNSLGEEDLALMYRIESTTVTTDSGRSADVGRFVIVGASDRTVGDVLRSQSKSGSEDADDRTGAEAWLTRFLTEKPGTDSAEVKKAARGADISERTLQRARKRLGVKPRLEGSPHEAIGSCHLCHIDPMSRGVAQMA